MKRTLQFALLLTALAWCVPAHATIAITDTIQQCNLPNTANGTCVVTLTHSTASGDFIFVRACIVNGFGSPAVTDSASQTYTSDLSYTVTLGGTYTCTYYSFPNSVSGVTTVTIKQSASSGHGTAWVGHATGVATASVVDTSATVNAGSTTPWSSTAINTGNANDLLLGVVGAAFGSGATCTPAVSGSWSLDGSVSSGANWDGGNGNAGMVGHQIVSSIGSYQFTGTDGNSTCTDKSSIVAYKGAATTVQGPPWYKLPTSGPSWVISILIGIMIGASGYGLPKVSDRGLVRNNISQNKSLLESIPIELWKTPEGVYESITIPNNSLTENSNKEEINGPTIF